VEHKAADDKRQHEQKLALRGNGTGKEWASRRQIKTKEDENEAGWTETEEGSCKTRTASEFQEGVKYSYRLENKTTSQKEADNLAGPRKDD